MNKRKPEPPPAPTGPVLPILAVTIEEAAEILRCGRTTLLGLIKDEKIRTVPVGRKRLVAIKEIERFLAGNAA